MNNIIDLHSHRLYRERQVQATTLNLFGAPIPSHTVIEHYEYFERFLTAVNRTAKHHHPQ
jgi:hypothetical protein